MGSEPDVGYYAPSTQESTAQQMQAMIENMPGLMNVLNSQILGSEKAKLDASKEISPEYAELTKQIYETTGRDLNKIGNEIAAPNQMAQAESAADVVAGPGRRLVEEGLTTAKIADPEYFKNRELAGARLAEMLNGGLTPGEEEAMGRSILKDRTSTGNLGLPSNTEAVKAATLYGGAARDRIGQALQLAAGTLPTFRTGVNPFEVKPTQPNTGDQRTGNAMTGLGSDVMSQGSNLLNQAGENNRTTIQSRTSSDIARMGGYRSPWENASSIMQGIGSIMG